MIRWLLLPFLFLAFGAQAKVEFTPKQDALQALRFSVDKQNQMTLGVSLAAFLAARQLDWQVKEAWGLQHRLGKSTEIGNDYLGTGVPGTLIGAGMWIWGANSENDHMALAGQAQLESLLVTGVSTAILKGTVLRERPDESDRFSFPSGHTSTVFATAQVFQEFYGWKFGAVGYAAGAFTAFSRVSENRHWLSDTVGGAALGMLIGHAISRAHLEPEAEDPNATHARVVPYVNREGGGLLVRADW